MVVTEDPDGKSYRTVYGYDVLDNLRVVLQGVDPNGQGGQMRLFGYDSLSRLTAVLSPETGPNGSLGATQHGYYDNGLLNVRVDPLGIVTMHVSNRHMELSSVVAGIAHANGLVSRMNNRAAHEGEDDSKYVFTSTVVISAREDSDFGSLREDPDWLVIEPPAGQRIWTDDYSNVLGVLRGSALFTELANAARQW